MVMRYFRVDTEPRGQGRPRFRQIPVTQNGKKIMMVRPYKAKDDKEYEELIRNAYLYTYNGIKPLDGPLSVSITARMPIPQSATKKERAAIAAHEIHPTKKPDVDNIGKAVLDALNGIAWEDDKQVILLMIHKAYENEDSPVGIEVSIRVVEPDDIIFGAWK